MSGKGAAGRITKNKKKTISLETKLDILRRFDKGEKAVEIAKAVGLSATTVRTIRDRDADKIREAAKSATSLDAKTMTRTRSECVHRICAAENDGTPAVRHEISNLARESNFEGMEETDINELLTSHNEEFSNEELLQLELEFANEEGDSNRSIEISEKQNLTSKQISKAMCLIDAVMKIFLKNDPDSGRSFKVSQAIATNINCYKEIYFTLKKKAVQQTLDQFFVKESRLTTTPIMDSSECD